MTKINYGPDKDGNIITDCTWEHGERDEENKVVNDQSGLILTGPGPNIVGRVRNAEGVTWGEVKVSEESSGTHLMAFCVGAVSGAIMTALIMWVMG